VERIAKKIPVGRRYCDAVENHSFLVEGASVTLALFVSKSVATDIHADSGAIDCDASSLGLANFSIGLVVRL
jgi:hypothetical protein